MNIEYRVERLNTFINEDRIIRGEWTGTDEQGRETACLLAALAPEVVEAEGEWACPANIMPSWFAYLTPWMDDNASDTEWHRTVRRYAACRRIEVAARRAAVVEAMRHMTDAQASAILLQVLAWLDAGTPEPERGALQAAALKAQGDAANVASAATRIADAPLYTAALAADMAGMAAEPASGTAAGLAAAAQRATADRITDAILSALEADCG
jgi:hypothetical protein